MANIEINQDDLNLLRTQLEIQNKITEQQRKEVELKLALEEAKKAQKMVEEKRCNPPKKNSKLLQKINQQNENDFQEPLPLKRLKLDEDGSDRKILGEIQNNFESIPIVMEKEFSFGETLSKPKLKQMDKENQQKDEGVFKTPLQPQQTQVRFKGLR